MKKTILISTSIFLVLISVVTVWAKPTGTTIDGNPDDWNDATCIVDDGGVDDESAPIRADITELCAHVDSSYVYVLMAWDDTGFLGGNASTAGSRVDINGDGVLDFIILGTLNGDPPSITSYTIGSCPGGTCNNADDVCSSDGGGGGPCTGVLAATGMTWDDPFDPNPGHAGGIVCRGTNCTAQDAFIEMAVPWSMLGLTAPPNPHVFGDYGSYPSGPAQAPKDEIDNSNNGISCLPDGTCYESTPTVITLNTLGADSASEHAFIGVGLFSLAVITTALFLIRKRSKH